MEEPNSVLRWAMFHFAGGDAFLCGMLGFVVCHVALLFFRGARSRRWLTIGARFGLIWSIAVLSPVPWPLIALFMALLVGWVASQCRNRKAPEAINAASASRREQLFRISLAGCALIAVIFELLHCRFSRPDSEVATLCVVGDSITAGLNDGEDTWPKRLSRRVAARILDASQPGATLKSARQQVELLNSFPGDVLLLEIGGNDLLEGLPLVEFEHDMDQLLAACHKPGRMAVMFELPLPPLATRYGTIQRHLARQHHVQLIPRRQMLGILTALGSTVDGIHLSATGHARLADLVQNLLNFPAGNSTADDSYRHLEPNGRPAQRGAGPRR